MRLAISTDASNKAKYSIVIPCKSISSNLKKTLAHYTKLNCAMETEIIILPDEVSAEELEELKREYDMKIHVIPTGNVSPSLKRNIGVKYSHAEVIAFIDDDAYPSPDWLTNALKYLKEPDVGAVGGPNLTPPESPLLEAASGLILASRLGSGSLAHRYAPIGSLREVDELPTCNLIIKKDVLRRVGGMGIDLWPGEDTHVCEQIRNMGYKIVYAPDVVVYHHRKPLFRPHLRQIAGYGEHRGYFARTFSKISRKPIYFMPSLLVIAILAGPLASLFYPVLGRLYVILLTFYLLACLAQALKARSLKLILLVFVGIILTHLVYGLAFIKGFLSPRLKR